MVGKKKWNKKRIVIAIAILITIIISLAIAISSLQTNETNVSLPSEIISAEELLKYYKCSDIKIKNSDEEMFEKDIYLTFGEDLFIEGKSNESYYKAITLYLTEILEFQNYRLIDSTRELVVAVIANSQDKKIEKIYFNGDLNYFEIEQTKQVLETYEKTKTTKIEIQSQEIKKCIQNNWKAEGIVLGKVESRYKEYDIYFDEGLEVKTLGGKIYNLVFTEKYQGNIINNLNVNSPKEEVVKTLGKPTFENKNVYGYKSDEMYVFFSEGQVSIYRKETDYKTEEFIKLWNTFQENKDVKKFVNELTNLWNDSNEYIYDSDKIYLEYALRGIIVQFNISTENGIILYQNYEGELADNLTLETLNSESLPKYVYIHKSDLVFEQEAERVSANLKYNSEELMNMVDENYFLEEEYNETFRFTKKESELFYLEYTYEPNEGIREVKFVSKNKQYPNSELIRHKIINNYGWKNDYEFIYSVKQEGIYCYNAITRTLKTIITGNESYKLEKVEGDTVFYDNTSTKIK